MPAHNRSVSTLSVVRTSLLVDVVDVLTNLAVALWTGSAVVFAEMAQGAADLVGSVLLLVGHRRSGRAPDAAHPLGYGREAFFWALLSALVMLVIGVGLSVWRGLEQLQARTPLDRPLLALAIVVLSTLTNAYAASRAVRRLRSEHPSLRVAYRTTSRQLVKTALLQDALGTLSALIGVVSILGYVAFGAVLFDALGALVLAALMAVLAGILVSQARSLITGRSVPDALRARMEASVRTVSGVVAINRLDAVFAGRDSVRVDVDLDLAEDLTVSEAEGVVDEVQGAVRAAVPAASTVRIDLNSPRSSGDAAPRA